jgi:hypothetical protein
VVRIICAMTDGCWRPANADRLWHDERLVLLARAFTGVARRPSA